MVNALVIASESAGNGKWLAHDINEVYWGSLAFVCVVGLLWWKAGPAITKAMKGRTARIQEELDGSALLRADAEAERDRIKAALADSDAEASRIVAEAQETAAKVKESIAERTEAEIVSLRERHAADMATTGRQAMADLTGEVSRLSLGAAERVIEANLDPDTQQSLIEGYIARVGATN